MTCGRGEVLWGAEDLSHRVQQAPKLGESLELPLGPPVSLKKVSGSALWTWSGTVQHQVQGSVVVQGTSVSSTLSSSSVHLQGDYILGGCQGSSVTNLSAPL